MRPGGRDAGERLVGRARLADDFDAVLNRQHRSDAPPDDLVIIQQEDANRISHLELLNSPRRLAARIRRIASPRSPAERGEGPFTVSLDWRVRAHGPGPRDQGPYGPNRRAGDRRIACLLREGTSVDALDL